MARQPVFRYSLLKCPWANSYMHHHSRCWMLLTAPFATAVRPADMPQVRHHRPDDIMWKNACRMTKTSPGLTFRPAAEKKPIRVSTCLCHFHAICICKPGSPIAPRLHGERKPIRQSGASEEQMEEPVPANPALPDTLPWEKQHGPIAGCTVSTLTHAARPAHQLLSARQCCWIYRWTTGEFKPAAPSWEGAYPLFICTSLTIQINITDRLCVCGCEDDFNYFFLFLKIIHRNLTQTSRWWQIKQTVIRVEGLMGSNITDKGVTGTIIPVCASGFI